MSEKSNQSKRGVLFIPLCCFLWCYFTFSSQLGKLRRPAVLQKRGSRDTFMASSHGVWSGRTNLMIHFCFFLQKNKKTKSKSGAKSHRAMTLYVLIVCREHVSAPLDAIRSLTRCSIPSSKLFPGSCNHGDALTTAVTMSLSCKYHSPKETSVLQQSLRTLKRICKG